MKKFTVYLDAVYHVFPVTLESEKESDWVDELKSRGEPFASATHVVLIPFEEFNQFSGEELKIAEEMIRHDYESRKGLAEMIDVIQTITSELFGMTKRPEDKPKSGFEIRHMHGYVDLLTTVNGSTHVHRMTPEVAVECAIRILETARDAKHGR